MSEKNNMTKCQIEITDLQATIDIPETVQLPGVTSDLEDAKFITKVKGLKNI